MQSCLLPQDTCDKIHRIVRGFIWNDSDERRHLHLFGWHIICRAKDLGGWGIRSMRHQNKAFMMKLARQFLTSDVKLWVVLLRQWYQRNYSFIDDQFQSGDSQVWRGVTLRLELLCRKGL